MSEFNKGVTCFLSADQKAERDATYKDYKAGVGSKVSFDRMVYMAGLNEIQKSPVPTTPTDPEPEDDWDDVKVGLTDPC